MASFFHAFFEDQRVQVMLLLVVLDLLLGVIAALVNKEQSFRLSYVADFARNDILGKVAPFAVLYAGYKYAANADIVIPGFDLEIVMNGAWVIVLASLVGSLLNSLRDLGLASQAPDEVAGDDPSSPTP